MNRTSLEQLAEQLCQGEISLEFFVEQARPKTSFSSVEMEGVTLDMDRRRRCGFPEVIFAEGKENETLRAIIEALRDAGEPTLATRVSPEQASFLKKAFSEGEYNPQGRTFRLGEVALQKGASKVAILSAGTSDFPVAEEARETLAWMGIETVMIQDVGVAGPHRLPKRLSEFEEAAAIVVVAGMEGALPSVVGGYVACPVIAVPTSVGYGASFGGIAALLSMLNCCAANVTVVNIDAGFKAGYVAGLIAK